MLWWMRKVVAGIPVRNLWINPDCGLKTRTWPETEAALAHMVAAARPPGGGNGAQRAGGPGGGGIGCREKWGGGGKMRIACAGLAGAGPGSPCRGPHLQPAINATRTVRPVMKIATWNVNSLSVRLPQVLAWLAANPVDALCLQELKLSDDKFPHAALQAAGYDAVALGQKTYNGVAILSRHRLNEVVRNIPDFG